jgi:hypothetical protein
MPTMNRKKKPRAAKKRHAALRQARAGKRRAKALAKWQRTACEGIACPRCGELTQVRTHDAITPRLKRQPFYFRQWYACLNPACATTTIMRDEDKVFPDLPEDEATLRLKAIMEQLQPR